LATRAHRAQLSCSGRAGNTASTSLVLMPRNYLKGSVFGFQTNDKDEAVYRMIATSLYKDVAVTFLNDGDATGHKWTSLRYVSWWGLL
jgi:hypothetical protein